MVVWSPKQANKPCFFLEGQIPPVKMVSFTEIRSLQFPDMITWNRQIHPTTTTRNKGG